MNRFRSVLNRLLKVTVVAFVFFVLCRPSLASPPLGTPEAGDWSDMAFSGSASGIFAASIKLLTISANSSNELEIGSQFGPSNPGTHYGAGGTLGGLFGATLSVSGVEIQPNGTVTNGGSLSIAYSGGVPGGLGDDYGIAPGASLLSGQVSAVLLDATGPGTLDVLFSITGGALQNINPSLGTNFSPINLGLLRIGSRTPPSGDFSTGFVLAGGTVDVFGVVPEPASMLLLFVGLTLTNFSRCHRGRRVG